MLPLDLNGYIMTLQQGSLTDVYRGSSSLRNHLQVNLKLASNVSQVDFWFRVDLL